MKNDMGYFYDVEPVVDFNHFVELLLVCLANKSSRCFYDGNINKIAVLPSDYKEIIENIMYSEDVTFCGFGSFINFNDYFEHQVEWENNLAYCFKQYLKSMKKNVNYDFDDDTILISFDKNEIHNILASYDQEIIDIMNNFITIMSNYHQKRKLVLLEKETVRNKKRKYIRLGYALFSKNWF